MSIIQNSFSRLSTSFNSACFDIRAALWPDSIWNTGRDISYIEDKCSLYSIDDEGMTVTKDGRMAFVVELVGKDYSGLEEDTMETLFKGRQSFFEQIPVGVTVFSQSHRQKRPVKFSAEGYSNPMAAEIAHKWYSNFTHAYRSKHYLVITSSHASLLKKGQQSIEHGVNKGQVSKKDLLLQTVRTCLNTFGSEIHGYAPKLLKGDDLTRYWAYLLSGADVAVTTPKDGIIGEEIGCSTLRFPKEENHQIYDTPSGRRYSGWWIIKKPDNTSTEQLMNSIFTVRQTFSVYQTYRHQEKNDSFSRLEERDRNFLKFEKASDEMRQEVEAMQLGLQGQHFTQFYVWIAIEVFGDTLDHLNQAMDEVRLAIENNHFSVARETDNQELTFWSRFPDMEQYQPRERECTSENAAHLTTFCTVGEGLPTCSWAKTRPSPIVHLPTVTGAVYSAVLHQSVMDKALANTLIIGGSEVGKTTAATFMLTNCFRFEDFRVLAFDRRHGMYVWTEFLDGNYLSIDDIHSMELQPFQMADNESNRTFLANWIPGLCGRLEQDDRDGIGKALMELYDLDGKQRNLEEFMPAVLNHSKTAAKRLQKWLPEGQYGQFFNGSKDALDFKGQQLVTVDMTMLLKQPEILGPLSSYIFHKNETAADGQHGYAVVIDEIPAYLENLEFASHIQVELREIRKNEGAIICMTQTASSILDFSGVSDFLNNIATYILFPEPKADPRHYIDQLGLNPTEFNWIKNTPPTSRHALFKRRGGESVLLDLNLSRLGKYMQCFNSGRDAVRHVQQLKATYGKDWKRHILG